MNVWMIYGIIAVLMFWFGYRGKKYGFLRTAFSMLTLVISIAMISILSPYVHTAMEEIGVPAKIYEKVSERMETRMPETEALSVEEQREWMQRVELPLWVQDAVVGAELSVAGAVIEKAAGYLSEFLVDLLAYVISFLLTFLMLRVISSFLGIVNHIPIIGGINRTLGLWLGLAEGLVILWISSLIITLAAATSWGSSLIALIESSRPLAWFYHTLLMLKFW